MTLRLVSLEANLLVVTEIEPLNLEIYVTQFVNVVCHHVQTFILPITVTPFTRIYIIEQTISFTI